MPTRAATTKSLTSRQVGLKYGFRSGLEERVAGELKAAGVKDINYETHTIAYTRPARVSRYTPDYVLPNGIVIETKGKFEVADRQKHLLIKEQHPDIDIRFVFQNPNARIRKGSKTTYAMWCKKHGFLYAKSSVPDAWLKERKQKKRIDAIKRFKKDKK